MSSNYKLGKLTTPLVINRYTSNSTRNITLVGAGLTGCLLAIYLAKRGFHVDIYEGRPDLRKTKIGGGRSINLTLAARGIQALKEVGLYDQVMQLTIPLKGRIIHALNGNRIFQPYGYNDSEVLYSLLRNELSILLLNELEKYKTVQVYFNQKCTGVSFEQRELYLQNQTTKEQTTVKVNQIIGTDGSASAIRTAMQTKVGFNFSQAYLDHGYKEITIPGYQSSLPVLERNALHVWPRKQYMINGFPNQDGSMTCVLFAPFEGENGLNNLNSKKKVLNLFQTQFPDILSFIPDLAQRYFSCKTGYLVTIKCQPWHVEDKALLLGDAAHAIVPFHGQGMNCAFEDCAYLDKCIEKHGTDWQSVFQEFERYRKVNTDAIADLSIQNYLELRDHVADSRFSLKKKVEEILADKYPEQFIPRFSMVCFHQFPYSIAQRRGAIQQSILEEICQNINDVEDINWEKTNRLIEEKLPQLCLPLAPLTGTSSVAS